MAESEFYLPLYKGANLEGWSLYRIGDGTWGKKPCDIGGFDPYGRGVILEVKIVRGVLKAHKPLPWSQFETQQRQWLERAALRELSLALVGIFEEGSHAFKLFHLRNGELDFSVDQLECHSLLRQCRADTYRNWPLIEKGRLDVFKAQTK